MLRLVGLVVSIGLADSLNPTTIAPALYLATGGERSRAQVAEFTFGVFAVYLLGGAIIALGPGQLILSLVPNPSVDARHIIECVAGAAMLVAAAWLWRHRKRLCEQRLPAPRGQGRSSAILGATITAIELPTAFPYFAAIAAIVGSGLDPARQLVLLLLFNICFIVPLLGILATVTFGGEHAERLLTIGRDFLQRYWPVVLAGLLFLAGLFVILLGITGLGQTGRGRFGRFMRRFRHLLHP
ncbi:MAG: GAP family protein [Solirubrobacteraceae bacterium]|jgi:cytochrome c biogenesis protein CcdA